MMELVDMLGLGSSFLIELGVQVPFLVNFVECLHIINFVKKNVKKKKV